MSVYVRNTSGFDYYCFSLINCYFSLLIMYIHCTQIKENGEGEKGFLCDGIMGILICELYSDIY